MAEMLRRLLLVLPAVAVGIVLWAVLSTGWPAPMLIARVVGGPTLDATVLAWQLSVQRLAQERREPSAGLGVRLLVDTGSEQLVWSGSTDGNGRVEASLKLAQPQRRPLQVRVESSDGQLLAQGSVELDGASWSKGARSHGGVLRGRQQGELLLLISPQEGTLAVPFASELRIDVSRGWLLEDMPGVQVGDRRVAGAELELELSGAELTEPATALRTDERGHARVALRPLEHAIQLQVRARLPAGVVQTIPEGLGPLSPEPGPGPATGEWYGVLPVTPGALHAAREGTRLVLRSPIPRDEAYVSIVSKRQRLAGYTVALAPDAQGGASGSVQLDAELLAGSAELYAVVSSEPDKRSPSAVGWQIAPTPLPAIRRTFDVADQLLLDGTAGVLQRERESRLARRSVAATLLALVGVSMVVAFSLEARSSARRAAAAPRELALSSQRWWLALALGCLLLGLGALTYFGLLQR